MGGNRAPWPGGEVSSSRTSWAAGLGFAQYPQSLAYIRSLLLFQSKQPLRLVPFGRSSWRAFGFFPRVRKETPRRRGGLGEWIIPAKTAYLFVVFSHQALRACFPREARAVISLCRCGKGHPEKQTSAARSMVSGTEAHIPSAFSPPRLCPLRFSARRTGVQGRSPAALFPRFLSRERNRAAGGLVGMGLTGFVTAVA